MALEDWEPRPSDEAYYAERSDYVRMGDVFQDVPLEGFSAAQDWLRALAQTIPEFRDALNADSDRLSRSNSRWTREASSP